MSGQNINTYRSIDEVLGSREKRFFGEGFKQVHSQLTDLTLDSDEQSNRISATASLVYPKAWSRKGSSELRPHLSTLDVMVLAAGLAEVHAARVLDLSEQPRRRAWIRRFAVRAGNAPQEDLAAIPVTAVAAAPVNLPFSLGGWITVITCTVGSLKVSCELEHEEAAWTQGSQYYHSLEEALELQPTGTFADRHRRRSHTIRDVSVHHADQVTALIALTPDASSTPEYAGLSADYEPALGLVDGIVGLAQLAQVLLYDLDDVDRSQSETLWMRSTWIQAASPYQPMSHPFVAALGVTKARLLNRAGVVWRTAEVAGDFQGLQCGASLAHRLPADSRHDRRASSSLAVALDGGRR